MSYAVVRTKNGWIINENGDCLIKDSGTDSCFWVPFNTIGFDGQNKPYFLSNPQGPLNIIEYAEEDNSSMDTEKSEDHEEESEELINETSENYIKRTGAHNETMALISAVEERYKDMHHIIKRKNFWTVISELLNSENVMACNFFIYQNTFALFITI